MAGRVRGGGRNVRTGGLFWGYDRGGNKSDTRKLRVSRQNVKFLIRQNSQIRRPEEYLFLKKKNTRLND